MMYSVELYRKLGDACGWVECGGIRLASSEERMEELRRQARQAIRRLRRERPHARIVVTGCAAQTEPETFAAMDEVDRVVGNGEKLAVASWTSTRAALEADVVDGKVAVTDIMAVR